MGGAGGPFGMRFGAAAGNRRKTLGGGGAVHIGGGAAAAEKWGLRVFVSAVGCGSMQGMTSSKPRAYERDLICTLEELYR